MSWIAAIRSTRRPKCDQDSPKNYHVRQTSPSFPRSRRRGGSFSALLASELQALASFAATPEGRSALAKLPALGAVLTPIVERQIADAERDFRER